MSKLMDIESRSARNQTADEWFADRRIDADALVTIERISEREIEVSRIGDGAWIATVQIRDDGYWYHHVRSAGVWLFGGPDAVPAVVQALVDAEAVTGDRYAVRSEEVVALFDMDDPVHRIRWAKIVDPNASPPDIGYYVSGENVDDPDTFEARSYRIDGPGDARDAARSVGTFTPTDAIVAFLIEFPHMASGPVDAGSSEVSGGPITDAVRRFRRMRERGMT